MIHVKWEIKKDPSNIFFLSNIQGEQRSPLTKFIIWDRKTTDWNKKINSMKLKEIQTHIKRGKEAQNIRNNSKLTNSQTTKVVACLTWVKRVEVPHKSVTFLSLCSFCLSPQPPLIVFWTEANSDGEIKNVRKVCVRNPTDPLRENLRFLRERERERPNTFTTVSSSDNHES